MAATALGSASSAATFEVKPDYYPDIMVINGEIKEGDGINFIRALVSSPTPIKLLRLNSLGGEMVAGKVIAAMTRTMMLNTVVGNKDTCASMCVLIFAAGIKRMHFSTGSIGVHSLGSYYPNVNQSFEDDSAKADNTNIAREFKRYGTPDSIIGKMITTPHDNITWLKTNELAAEGFSTVFTPDDEPPQTTAAVPQYVPPLSYAPTPAPEQPTPAPSYVPNYNNWSMTCQSTATGSLYGVSIYNNGTIAIGKNMYRVDDGHFAKNGAGSYLAKGRTKYGHYVAVFHSTNPQPYIAFVNRKGERVKDWCR